MGWKNDRRESYSIMSEKGEYTAVPEGETLAPQDMLMPHHEGYDLSQDPNWDPVNMRYYDAPRLAGPYTGPTSGHEFAEKYPGLLEPAVYDLLNVALPLDAIVEFSEGDPTSLFESLLMGAILPPTLRNVVRGAKKTTKSLNPYQARELVSKVGQLRPGESAARLGAAKYGRNRKAAKDFEAWEKQLDDDVLKYANKLKKEGKFKGPTKKPKDLPGLTKAQKEAQDLMLREFSEQQRIKDINMLDDALKKLKGDKRNWREMIEKIGPAQKATSKSTALRDIGPILPFLAGGIAVQQMKDKSSESEEGSLWPEGIKARQAVPLLSPRSILDSLVIDQEDMEFRGPSLEGKVLEMLMEDSRWRY